MRILLALFAASSAVAQEPAPAAESPVPAAESWLKGSMDVGYRWRTDVGGNSDAYRSVVDLGSGPKLFGADFSLTDPGIRWFDRIDVRAHNWGDDPYSTAHVSARKRGLY